MKKTIPILVMAALCLIINLLQPVQAQENKAIDITKTGIQIGQKLPEQAILSIYKGKMIILDFWATWCSPCVAMIPKLEALQKQFNDQIQIVSVTYQPENVVFPFLEKLQKGKPSILPNITGDQQLHKLFPHLYLPHYVWINKDGTVCAITGYQEVTAVHISKMLNSTTYEIALKRDMKLDYTVSKPFLVQNNGGDGSSLIFHSVLTGFVEGIPGGYRVFPGDSLTGRRIVFTNVSLSWLYRIAYGGDRMYLGNNRVVYEVDDPGKFSTMKVGEEYQQWAQAGNVFCYELQVPGFAVKNFFSYLQQDLQKFFPQYVANLVKRKTQCLALVRTSSLDKIKTHGGSAQNNFTAQGFRLQNFPLEQFIVQLSSQYLQNSPLPLINQTGYTEYVAIAGEANMTDINSINLALAKYDLKLVNREAELELLVIKDLKPFKN